MKQLSAFIISGIAFLVNFKSMVSGPFDAAIGRQIDRFEKSVGFGSQPDFDFIKYIGVIQKTDLLADQGCGRLVEPALKTDGSILGHFPPGDLPEIILYIIRRFAEAVGVGGEALERRLAGGAMNLVVI